MARPPAFDRSEVVEKAMEVFWRAGYQGASIKLLGAAMGLRPGSIYAAFGSKEELFREALGAYVARIRARAAAARVPPHRLLERWFAAHVDASLAGHPPGRGCLLLNSAAEVPGIDAETARFVRAELETLEALFRAAVAAARRGKRHGGKHHSSKHHRGPSAAVTARMLVAALAGIGVMSRAGAPRSALEDVARGALSLV